MNLKQPKFWQTKNFFSYILWPFSFLFYLLVQLRLYLYHKNIFKTTKFKIPVIVIGNISVGGTGKTPLVIWLAEFLVKNNFKPGIVTRGFGGGDEFMMIKQRLHEYNIPVVANANRVLAVKELLAKNPECNVIISDDGMQHYALARDFEIAVIDGDKGFGNGFCLPAGFLREPITRLNSVNLIVINDTYADKLSCSNCKIPTFIMQLIPDYFCKVSDRMAVLPISNAFKNLEFKVRSIHAVAGIGNPERFFNTLEKLNLNFTKHIFPDHYKFKPKDLDFGPDIIVLMTEKDAVKCISKEFNNENYWFLRVHAEIDPEFGNRILEFLKKKLTK